MARYLFQISDKDISALTAVLATARACLKRGDEILFFLSGDGAYLADPEQWLGPHTRPGFDKPAEMTRWLLDNGAKFYVARACAEFREIKPAKNVAIATFDQLAEEMASFDQVMFC